MLAQRFIAMAQYLGSLLILNKLPVAVVLAVNETIMSDMLTGARCY